MKEGIFVYFVSRPSKQLVVWCGVFLCGVALVTYVGPFTASAREWYALFLVVFVWSVALAAALWKRIRVRIVCMCIAAFMGGAYVGCRAMPPPVTPDRMAFFNNQTHTVTGWIFEEPDVRDNKVTYHVRDHGGVLVSAPLYPRFSYGDTVQFSCTLKQPATPKRLWNEGIESVCAANDMRVVGANRGNAAMRLLLYVKNIVRDRIAMYVREPAASLLEGFLYGERARLPPELYDALIRTSTVHVIAVSGFNITILMNALVNALVFIGLSRRRVLPVLVFCVVVFTIFTGASASVVRAAMMGILAAIARHIGRMSSLLPSLGATAATMVLAQPFIFLYDAGFQLSFMSTLGLVYIAPYVERVIKPLPNVLGMRDSAAQTIGATIATTPLIIFLFGRLSLVGIVVNVLILWTVPYIMMAGCMLLIIGCLLPPLAVYSGYIVEAALTIFIDVIQFFGALPFSSRAVSMPWWGMAACYVFITVFLIKMYERKTHH